MAQHNSTGHPIMDVVLAIGGSLAAMTLAILDHFFLSIKLETVDIVFGFVVKAMALAASFYTIKLVRSKLKKRSKNDED